MTKNIQLKQHDTAIATAPKDLGTVAFVAHECIQCGACMEECRFLQTNGLPGQIAEKVLKGKQESFPLAFSCSLCRLCTHLCPKQLPIADMFLELRRKAVASDRKILGGYRPLRFYEALGGSALLKRDFLPEGCDTVFFPGCALPGIRPEQTEQLFSFLQTKIPQLGLVLDCCGKPSHDLGDQQGFSKKNKEQMRRLRDAGVHHIITSCSSCLQVFKSFAQGIETSMVYTHLLGQEQQADLSDQIDILFKVNDQYTIHDPCTMRFESGVQASVRDLISGAGGVVTEMKHSGARTLCCGEGGAVGFKEKENKIEWQRRRKVEAGMLPMVTYCAGCTVSLHSATTVHILDLIFPIGDRKKNRLTKPPLTYINRFLFKRKMASYFKVLLKRIS